MNVSGTDDVSATVTVTGVVSPTAEDVISTTTLVVTNEEINDSDDQCRCR